MTTAENVSTYVDADFYQKLEAVRLESAACGLSSGAVPRAVRALLLYEARLLDMDEWHRWMELFDEELLYWLPSTDDDPRRSVSVMFDDRRRLLDRLARYDTGLALERQPVPRLVRQVSSLEAFPQPDGSMRVLSCLTAHQLRGEQRRVWVARVEHVLVPVAERWLIRQKVVRLLDRDRGLEPVPLL